MDDVKADPDCPKDVEGGRCDGIHPICNGNACQVKMGVLHPATRSGDCKGKQAKSRAIEVNPGLQMVVNGTEYNGTGPSSNGNTHVVKTNMLHPDVGLVGHRGDQAKFWGVEDCWTCQIIGESTGDEGRCDGKDVGVSRTHHESKQLDTDLLAEEHMG